MIETLNNRCVVETKAKAKAKAIANVNANLNSLTQAVVASSLHQRFKSRREDGFLRTWFL